MSEKKSKRICIGIPHTGLFPWNTTFSLLSLKAPHGFEIFYHGIGSCLIYDARDQMAEFAKEKECDYLMMIDSDMVVPNDTMLKMVGLLENKQEIDMVTGVITKRIAPYQPCMYSKMEYRGPNEEPYLESPCEFPDEGLLPLAGMGMACCMMRVNIFDRIDKLKGDNIPSYFFPLPNFGEDLTFCLLASNAGVKMVADLSIQVGHVSAEAVGVKEYRICYDEFKKRNEGNGKQIFGKGEIKNGNPQHDVSEE